jgi:hypothetical protein
MKNLFIALGLITISQILVYLQLQGQFFSNWIKGNPLTVSLLGIPISLILIEYTKRSAMYFDGEVWPGRLMGYAIGIIVFTILSYTIFNEPLTGKTIACLILSSVILVIQLFF